MKILDLGQVDVSLTFKIDPDGATLVALVLLLSSLVWIFSMKYIKDNRTYYFLWLGVFVLSMIGFLTSGNLGLTFLFWEGLGLSSYFLVRFFCDSLAEQKARHVFIFNRVADIGFLVMLAVCAHQGTFDMALISSELTGQAKSLFIVGLLMCSFGKSAQAVFYPWLKSAMAGPTPVSSLLHSATMVGAGAILFNRFREIIPAETLDLVFYTTAVTYIIVAVSAIFSKDAKELLAYSTVSNLSLLFMITCVKPEYFIPMFVAHAYFKCGAFLLIAYLSKSSGSTTFSELNKNAISWTDFTVLVALSASLMSVAPFGVGLFKPETSFTYISSILSAAYGYKFFRELVKKPTYPFSFTSYSSIVAILAILSIAGPLYYLIVEPSVWVGWFGLMKSIFAAIIGVTMIELIRKKVTTFDPATLIEFIIIRTTRSFFKSVSALARAVESSLGVVISSFQDSVKLTGELFNWFTYRGFQTIFVSLLLVWLILIFLS